MSELQDLISAFLLVAKRRVTPSIVADDVSQPYEIQKTVSLVGNAKISEIIALESMFQKNCCHFGERWTVLLINLST